MISFKLTRSKLLFLLLSMHLLLLVNISRAADQPVTKKARPASSYVIENNSEIEVSTHKNIYVRGTGSTDLGTAKTFGGGIAAGWMFDAIHVGVAFDYYAAKYGSLLVHDVGVKKIFSDNDSTTTDTTPPANAEVSRKRDRGDASTLILVGPEIGYHFKLFKSEHWVESARFRIGYASWNDQTSMIKFTGNGVTMTGSFGYLAKRFMIAPAVSWNLIYLTRPDGLNALNGVKSHDYLSLQLWTAQLDATFFF